MISRFYGYINKVFRFQELVSRLTDSLGHGTSTAR